MGKQDDDQILMNRLRAAEDRGYNKALGDLEWTSSFILHGKPENDLERGYNHGVFSMLDQMKQMRRPKS